MQSLHVFDNQFILLYSVTQNRHNTAVIANPRCLTSPYSRSPTIGTRARLTWAIIVRIISCGRPNPYVIKDAAASAAAQVGMIYFSRAIGGDASKTDRRATVVRGRAVASASITHIAHH